MIWYYIDASVTDGERRKGPFQLDEIREFVKNGIIKEDTLVWHSGMEAWVPWKDTEQKKDVLSEEEQIRAALETILAEHSKGKHFAGFFIRGAAFIVDNFILSIIGVLLLLGLQAMQIVDIAALSDLMNIYINDPSSEGAFTNLLNADGVNVFLTLWGIVQAVYFVVFTAIFSATPGKILFRIHVEAPNGEKLGWLQASIRYVASLFTQFTLTFYGLGYLVAMIDPKRRTLHDFVARTRVVYNPKIVTVSTLPQKQQK